MKDIEQILKIIDEVNKITSKKYHKMSIKELSQELRNMIAFEQKIFQKIENLEKKEISSELMKYAKMICRNTSEREILEIQEIYLKKIDKKYLKNLKK